MIPETVIFTNFSFDPKLVRPKKHNRNIPHNWTRHAVRTEPWGDQRKFDQWMETHMEGRWARVDWVDPRDGTFWVMLSFEIDSDAMYFALSEGHTIISGQGEP